MKNYTERQGPCGMIKKLTTKEYLGDSVYVMFDGFGYTLTTENGFPHDPSNTIYLEPDLLRNLPTLAQELEQEYVEEIG